MSIVCAKLRQREKNKYRKVISVDEEVYSNNEIAITSSSLYTPGASLEEGEWFYVNNASKEEYKVDIMKPIQDSSGSEVQQIDTVDFNSLNKSEISKIDFIFLEIGNVICFQKISRVNSVSKKGIIYFGESFEYQKDRQEIIINKHPDAIYDRISDKLYFKRLESITSIFKGIDQIYREATDTEVREFLGSDFIKLKEEYGIDSVKTANRKRIALAQNTLNNLNDDEKKDIFKYIGEYCPKLVASDNSFEIGSEEELKLLLYGIEQRFYTTIVGNEKRIANSVLSFS